MAVHESKGMGFLDDLPWIFAGSVMMSSHRDHLFADELASQILEFLLFREEVWNSLGPEPITPSDQLDWCLLPK